MRCTRFLPHREFCRHHERLAEKHGEDAIRNGRYPRTRTPRQKAPLEAQLDAEYVSNGCGAVTPAAVRPALAQAAADDLGTITAILMDAATNTTRPCGRHRPPKCGTRASSELLDRVVSKPQAAPAAPTVDPNVPPTTEGIERLSTEELLNLIVPTHVVAAPTEMTREERYGDFYHEIEETKDAVASWNEGHYVEPRLLALASTRARYWGDARRRSSG